ncbi:hypothetical protein [Bacillus sp. AK128]
MRHTKIVIVYTKVSKRKENMMKKKDEEKHINVSGSFQIVNEERREELDDAENRYGLDEESLYYARQFMED